MLLSDETKEDLRWDQYRAWVGETAPGEAADFDDVLRSVGLKPLGQDWIEHDRAGALAVAKHVLSVDMVWSRRYRTPEQAEALATTFLDAVGTPARYTANLGRPKSRRTHGGGSATEHTFDAGVVALGPLGGVVFWVADED